MFNCLLKTPVLAGWTTVLAAVAVVAPAHATDFFWNNSTFGLFTSASNWDPAGGPGGADDTVNFNLGVPPESRYFVFNLGGENHRLLVHHDSLTLNIPDNYSLLSNEFDQPSFTVGVASGDTADVSLIGPLLAGTGTLQTQHASIGHAEGSTGIVTVNSRLQWVAAGDLNVGRSGSGTLTIANGGSVSNTFASIGDESSSTGAVTVTGAESTWTNSFSLVVGHEGTGTLTIEDNGSVSSSSTTIGKESGSSGSVTISGAGSTWMNGEDLHVAFAGDGMLTIENGGSVSNRTGFVASQINSTGMVTVNGAGSTWTNDHLIIGNEQASTGALTIEDGGTVFSFDGWIGGAPGAAGTVVVTGDDSTWTSGRLLIGIGGSGALTIQDGGRVSSFNQSGHRLGFLAGSTGEVTVTGAGSTWTSNFNDLHVGDSGTGALTIENGGNVTNQLGRIGSGSGSGYVLVTGTNSTWTNNANAFVGENGQGLLTIEQGGSVSNLLGVIGVNPGSVGAATVIGDGSTWTNNGGLRVGNAGTGTLEIRDGGSLVTSTIFASVIGFEASGVGALTVADIGSQWTNTSELRIANFGAGTMAIESGGSVSNTNGHIAFQPGSSGAVTVTGASSVWTNSGELVVGNSGSGTLTIQHSGTVSNTVGSIGLGSGSQGIVTITGVGSTWINSGSLAVGEDGTGTLNILGGEVVVGGTLSASSESNIRLNGGKLTVNQLGSGAADALDWRSGTLRVTGAPGLAFGANGAFGSFLALNQPQLLEVDHALSIEAGATLFAGGGLKAGSAAVAPGGQLFVGGTPQQFGSGLTNSGHLVFTQPSVVTGPITNATGGAITAIEDVTFNDLVDGPGGFFGPGTITFAGGFSPGASPAAVGFEGSVALAVSNTLVIELAGTTPGIQYDVLQIAGAAALGGTLAVSLLDGFTPSAGDVFEIITAAAGVAGSFSSELLPPLAEDLFWRVNYGASSVSLSVAVVPEPGGFVVVLMAMIMGTAARRR